MNHEFDQDFERRVKTIRDELTNVANTTDFASPCVLAATKQQAVGAIRQAVAAGITRFGENRVQEAEEKWNELKQEFPHLQLHLIGPLQTNKVKEAVALFDCIETLDREKLADKLAEEMSRQGRKIPCLIQVNIGREPQKAGVEPDDLPAFLSYCRDKGLEIAGLMCVPPVDRPPAPYFALMQKYRQTLRLAELSMGMSGDYKTAAKFGSTEVRLGTVLFGERA